MLTDVDVKKLTDVFATREEIAKKFEVLHQEIDVKFEAVQQSFSDLQTAVDSYAKRAEAFFQELVMLAHKVDRHEKWLHQIADKLGIKLEY